MILRRIPSLRWLIATLFLTLGILWAQPAAAETWEPLQGITSTYAIYACDFVYGSTPMLITDMRTGDVYDNKESYEARGLTVYRPGDETLFQRRPVVIYVHGGGWTDGYREGFAFVGHTLTGELGWVTVIIDYRLTSNQVFLADAYCPDRATCSLAQNEILRTKAAWYPDNIQDVAAAITWTVDHIGRYGGDPNRIVVLGHSAGGHLAALATAHPDYVALRARIRGTVSLSGAFELNALDKAFWASAVNQTFPNGFENTALLDDGSASTHVQADSSLPPFYLLYAEDELRSLTEQNVLFYNKLVSLGHAADTSYLAGYGHVTEMEAFTDVDATPTELVVTWIQDVIKQRISLPLLYR